MVTWKRWLELNLPFINLRDQYLELKEELLSAIEHTLEHGQYIMGPEVADLEHELKLFTGSEHCITVASGTEALLMSLMAIGVREGDEVITTPFTFVATAEVVVLLGATPVFVDIDPDTCNIDPKLIEEKITSKTKAIIPVSLYGQPSDMDEINEIAHRHGLIVIEDAAQSFGATYKGKRSCNLSDVGCTSFFPSKPLGCYGDGGAIFTNDDDLADALREIRVHGQSERYVHTRVGVGGRMDTLQCAVVLKKLKRFGWEVQRRHELGDRYFRLLMEHQVAISPEEAQHKLSGRLAFLTQKKDRAGVFAQFTVRVGNRDRVRASMEREGIPTAVHYPIPLNKQAAYEHFCCSDCTPHANRMAEEVLSLPMSADLKEEDQDKVVKALCHALAIEK